MITNFEEITKPVSEIEEQAIQWLIDIQCFMEGSEVAITNKEIAKLLKMKFKEETFNGPRLRKMINYIRREKLVKNLIATSKGYYTSNDKKEIAKYKQSLQERAAAILEIADTFN